MRGETCLVGRGREPDERGSASLELSAGAAGKRAHSTLRPRRSLSAPSPRAAEPRNPATAHHSRLGTVDVSTVPGALTGTVTRRAAVCLLQFHYHRNTAAYQPLLPVTRICPVTWIRERPHFLFSGVKLSGHRQALTMPRIRLQFLCSSVDKSKALTLSG